MRIYTKSGDLAFSTFTFPDGQPHFRLETYEREFNEVTIETAIKSPSDLFLVLLACNTCRNMGYSEVRLDIRYLLGARMDRTIDSQQPFTLQTVARIINSCGFSKVRILDVHSEVALRLIRNSKNVLPYKVVEQVFSTIGNVLPVRPDRGAEDRVMRLISGFPRSGPFIRGTKQRDPATGQLSRFEVDNYRSNGGWDCLIIDDICDGGTTFVGLARELRKAGAKKVYLYITHAVFSKGIPLEGVDHIYTTDSYCDRQMSTYHTSIPISMKDLV